MRKADLAGRMGPPATQAHLDSLLEALGESRGISCTRASSGRSPGSPILGAFLLARKRAGQWLSAEDLRNRDHSGGSASDSHGVPNSFHL